MPLLLLLIICHLSTLTDACIPMQPPERLPCPAAPKPTMLTGNTEKEDFSHISGPKPVNGETVYTCDSPAAMVSSATPTLSSTKTTIVCKPNTGYWVVRDSEKNTDTMITGGTTYYCKETVDCSKCQTKVQSKYITSPAPPDAYVDTVVATRMGTSCIYNCNKKPGYDVFHPLSTWAFDSITCNANTEYVEFTPDRFPAPNEAWVCAKCVCSLGTSTCPAGFDCAKPVVNDPTNAPCVYNCPMGTTTYYKDKTGALHSTTIKDLKCAGSMFRSQLPDYSSELYCRKAGPPGSPDLPPNSGCSKLPEPNPSYMTMDMPPKAVPGLSPSQIRYTIENGKDIMTCETGAIYYPGNEPGSVTHLTCEGNAWSDGIVTKPAAVTCLPDYYGVETCLANVDPDQVKDGLLAYDCRNGLCRIYCKEPLVFTYDIPGGGSGTAAEAYCIKGEIFPSIPDYDGNGHCE